MRYGICIGTDISMIATAAACGYDYIETGLSDISRLSDGTFEAFRAELDKYCLKAEVCNGFFGFPRHYLVTAQADMQEIAAYVRCAFARVSLLGLQVAVLGSGNARMLPENADKAACEEQFLRILRLVGDIAEEYNITVAIEPLTYAECNFINTVADALDIASRANHPRIRVMGDFYHIHMNGEGLEALTGSGNMLRHLHIARPNIDRCMPVSEEDRTVCRVWAQALAQNGYNDRISLEGNYGKHGVAETLTETRKTLALFQK